MLQKQSNTEELTGNSLFKNCRANSATLIGTIHLDISAYKNLMDLLTQIRPDCIAVEISPFSVAYRKKHQKYWTDRLEKVKKGLPAEKRGHFRIELLFRQLKMPFEWETACLYARQNSIPCTAIDCGEISKKELPLWEKELINESNLLLATSEPDQPIDQYFLRHYRQALRSLAGQDTPWNKPVKLVFDHQWCKREKILASRLLSLSLKYENVVYIGGWMHLVQGPKIFSLANLARMAVKERFLVTGRSVHKL